MTSVLVVDDHQLFRRGVADILAEHGFEIAGEAGDGEEAVHLAASRSPDIILMDLHMPGTDGIEATRQLAPRFPILVLTFSDSDADLARALQAGACGYVLKHIAPRKLIDAIQDVIAGHDVLSQELVGAAMKAVRGHATAGRHALSARETQVLGLIAKGRSNAEIARALKISDSTVKTYAERLFDKLGVHSRSEAAAIAGSMGLS